jgi:hypothetical protein
MSDVWSKVKAAAAWVWHWITVIVATVTGFLAVAVNYIDQVTGLDLTQIMTKERAAEVMFWTAVTKMAVSSYNAWKAPKDA